MQSALAWKIGLGGVTLAVLMAAGCNRDGRDFGRGIAGPAAGVAEGARVRGTYSETADLLEALGQRQLRSTRPVPFEATVQRGVARLDSAGGIVAARGLGLDEPLVLSRRDPAGHLHELVMASSEGGGPVDRIRQSVDGQLTMEVTLDWRPHGAGFLLRSRELVVYRGGQRAFAHRRDYGDVEVAQLGDPHRLVAAAAGWAVEPFVPAVLMAQTQQTCFAAWIQYLAAAGAVVLATERVALTPIDMSAWVALATAITFWERSLDNLLIACAPVQPEL